MSRAKRSIRACPRRTHALPATDASHRAARALPRAPSFPDRPPPASRVPRNTRRAALPHPPTHRDAMTALKQFLRTGHGPTLFAAFLYFAFSFVVWVLNGAMAPFISETFGLDPAHKGLMLSVPIVAGALMRFPLGLLSQYI